MRTFSARAMVAVLAATAVIGGCAQVAKPVPPAAYAGAPTGFDGLAPTLRSVEADILFITDRKKEVDAYGREIYGIGRSPSLAYGSAVVRIEAGEGWDDLVAWTESRPDAPAGALTAELVSLTEKGRFPATPYLYRIDEQGNRRVDPEIQREVDALDREASLALDRRLAVAPQKRVDIYVHGIRTRFEGFVVDIAKDWHLAGRTSVPIAYSWPAGGGGLLSAYAYDRESGEFTVPHFKQVIRAVADNENVEQINLFAHSRGTDVVTSALRELFIEARAGGDDARERFKIENVVLVAPDLDLEVIIQRMGDEGVGSDIGRVTIYSNADDAAIAAAQSLFSSRARLGSIQPEQLSERQLRLLRRATNVDVVVYTGAGGGQFRHSYWRTPAVRADMILGVRDGREPGAENGRPLEPLGNHFWKLGDDYLQEN